MKREAFAVEILLFIIFILLKEELGRTRRWRSTH